MLKKYTLIIFLTFLVVFKSQSQSQTENYPVSATLVFAAPFSLKVSDYFTSNTRMYLNLNLKDLTKPTLKVYLKWSLEGPGIRISTRDGFIPTSFIELNKGVNLQKGSDLGVYFQRGMLDYQGIDEGVVFNGSIPEGFYTMKFQALEANSGREVSNLTESFFFVTSPQPPIITQPFNGSIVPVSNPQNVLLQWTPRQISTLESQVVYEVTIYEVAEGDDPVVVANSGILPKFNRTVSTTSTLMGASDLPLQEGKRYAMVVTAKDLNGKMNFENGGKSEVSWFQYGKGCFAPAGLDVAETAPGKVILSWTPNTTAEGYVIEHKKKTESTWIINGSTDNSFTLNGLSPQTDYEFRVKTQCSGGKYSAYTATESVSVIGLITPTPETALSLADVLDPFSQTVSTKSDGKPFDPQNLDALLALLKPHACAVSGVSYVCGQTPNATPPVGIDLTTLAKGDVLGIYDYAVLVTEVSKGSSPFTGKGLVKLPFAGNIKVPVEFKGIKAKKGEDGKDGGCVWYVPADLNEGYFQVKGSQQDAIVKEQEKLLADIYSELIDPQSFYGTFEEALAKYEAKSKEIQVIEDAGNKARKEDYQELTKNLRGIVQGGNDWKEKLLKHFGSDANKPENKAILDKLDALKAALLACEKCVADNLSTTPPKTGGGGGPMGFEDWEVNLAKCVYPDAQKEMGDIKTQFSAQFASFPCLGILDDCDKIQAQIEQFKMIKQKKQTYQFTVLNDGTALTGSNFEVGGTDYGNMEMNFLGKKDDKFAVDFNDYTILSDGIMIKAKLIVGTDEKNWKSVDFIKITVKESSSELTKMNIYALSSYIFGGVYKSKKATFPITGAQLKLIFPETSTSQSRCDEVAELINKYSNEFGLTTPERMSHFIGQIGAESNLSALKEGFSYPKARIKEIFGSRPEHLKYCDLYVGYESDLDVCVGSKPASCTPSLTELTADLVVKDKYANSLKLFDYTYSCRLGNGTPNSGDGGRFRGRAFLHLTGRDKYETLETKWNATFPNNKKDFTCDSDVCESTRELLIDDLDFSMKSSLAFWSSVKANDFANTVTDGSITKVSSKVNGGTNGLPTRKTLTKNAYKILSK